MKNIAIIILLIVINTMAGKVGYTNTQPNTARLDSLIDSLAPYLSTPMGWCEVSPTSIEVNRRNDVVMQKEQIRLVDIGVNVQCSNEFQIRFNQLIRRAMGTRTHGAWSGWLDTQIVLFENKVEGRFPWIDVRFNEFTGEMHITGHQRWASRNASHNALILDISINGTRTQHRTSEDTTRQIPFHCLNFEFPIASFYESGDVDDLAFDADMMFQSFINDKIATMVKQEGSADIEVNKVYKTKTNSDSRGYSFISVAYEQ